MEVPSDGSGVAVLFHLELVAVPKGDLELVPANPSQPPPTANKIKNSNAITTDKMFSHLLPIDSWRGSDVDTRSGAVALNASAAALASSQRPLGSRSDLGRHAERQTELTKPLESASPPSSPSSVASGSSWAGGGVQSRFMGSEWGRALAHAVVAVQLVALVALLTTWRMQSGGGAQRGRGRHQSAEP